MRRKLPVSSSVALAILVMGASAQAVQTTRVQVDQRGYFAKIGAPIGYDCAPGGIAPINGTVGNCGLNTSAWGSPLFTRLA